LHEDLVLFFEDAREPEDSRCTSTQKMNSRSVRNRVNLASEEKVITPLKRISIEISKTNVMHTMYITYVQTRQHTHTIHILGTKITKVRHI
jgi:hypothetical protein